MLVAELRYAKDKAHFFIGGIPELDKSTVRCEQSICVAQSSVMPVEGTSLDEKHVL